MVGGRHSLDPGYDIAVSGDDLVIFLLPGGVEGRDQVRLAFDRLRAAFSRVCLSR
jgi:hypothetical protein